MHSPADILRYLIIDLGLGTLPTSNGNWPVYTSDEPTSPDSCITTYDTTGRDGGRIMYTGEREEYPGVQVRIRGKDHTTAFVKAQAVAETLDKGTNNLGLRLVTVTIDAASYLVYCVIRTGSVQHLGKESPTSKRKLFVINCLIRLERTA